jgi:hypothetical protein
MSKKEDELAAALVKNQGDDVPYGIVRKRLSFKELSNLYQGVVNQGKQKHHEEDDDDKSSVAGLLTKPPTYQKNWLELVRIELTAQEAKFIKDKLCYS